MDIVVETSRELLVAPVFPTMQQVPLGHNNKLRRMALERTHRGDFMDRATRSRVMSRIRGRDTGPERTLARLLADAGVIAELQPRDLPGKPDFVLRDKKLVIFVDGDFWHGWRFSRWRMKLSEKWEKKIELNRLRDARISRRLRRQGWRVIRIWEHQIDKSPDFCVNRIRRKIEAALCKAN